jgi:hypothetical protein
MPIGEIILEYSTSLFDFAFTYFLVTRGLLKQAGNKLIIFAGVCFFALVNFYMNSLLGHDSIWATIIPIAGIGMLSWYTHKVKFIRFVSVFFVIVLMLALVEFIVISILSINFNLDQSILMEYNIYRIYYGFLSKLFIVGPFLIFGRILSKEKEFASPVTGMMVVILLANVIIAFYGLKLYSDSSMAAMASLFDILAILISISALSGFIIFFSKYILDVERKQIYLEAAEKEYKYSIDYIKEIEKLYKDLKAQRHDYLSHLEAITGLLEDEKSREAYEYTKNVFKIEKYISGRIQIENPIIASVLSYKKGIAEEKGIDFKYHVTVPKETRIEDIDMTIVLSNAINNAIEACEKMKENKYIDIYMNYEFDKMKIKMVNTFEGELEIDKGNVETSKEDKSMHGIGLLNIRRVVSKYDGYFNIDAKEGLFILEVMI